MELYAPTLISSLSINKYDKRKGVDRKERVAKCGYLYTRSQSTL